MKNTKAETTPQRGSDRGRLQQHHHANPGDDDGATHVPTDIGRSPIQPIHEAAIDRQQQAEYRPHENNRQAGTNYLPHPPIEELARRLE